MFGLFKKKTRLKEAVDLSKLNCDVHSHLIPGIDDGAKDMEDSIALISGLNNLGYKKIITTPHIMADYYQNTPEIILSGLTKVRETLKEKNIPVEIEAASEYYIDFDFERKLEEEELLTFGGEHKYLLFEVSFMNAPANLDHIIFNMQSKGYKPVLAHPERYNFWHTDFAKYEALAHKGVILQLNINSLTGCYSESTQLIARKFIEKNMITMLGTDCHHSGHLNLINEVVYDKHLHQLVDSGMLINQTL